MKGIIKTSEANSNKNSSSQLESDVDTLIQKGTELRSQAVGMFNAKSGADTFEKLLQESLSTFESALKNPKFAKTPDFVRALVGYVETIIAEAMIRESLNPEDIEFSKHYQLLDKGLIKLQAELWVEGKNAETTRLEAKIYKMMAQHKAKFNPKQSENFYLNALEKLLASNKFTPDDERTLFMIQEILELLSQSPKDRKTQGQAVYNMKGTLVQTTTNVRSTKKRFFVVDDNAIKEYTKEKDWLTGPAEGKPGKPTTTILFAEVNAIVCHQDETKCNTITPKNKPSKFKGTYCIHLLTRDRIFNMLSVPKVTSLEEFQQWEEVLTNTLRSYKLKRDAKKLMKRENQVLQEINNLTDSTPSVQVKVTTNYPRKFSILKINEVYQNQKKSRRVHWAEKTKLVSVYDISTSPYPPTIWDEEEEEEDEDDNEQMVWMKRELSTMNEKHAFRILKKLFAQYEEEGLIQEALFTVVLTNPKAYLLRLSEIEEFDVAKYGMFVKALAYLKKIGKL